MRLGAFDINEPVPELNEPHALAIIPSWLDVGGVGSLILSQLETNLGCEDLARLATPGNFFDFTRYRPTLRQKDNYSEVEIPNAFITFGKKLTSRDYIFLRLPESHMMAEAYVDSVVELLKTFNVKRYCLFGSIYDMVPYTRPLLVTGSASNVGLQNKLTAEKVINSDYQGPSSILHLVGEKALQLGMETLSLILHLPCYLPMSEDYKGVRRLMEIICSLYDFVNRLLQSVVFKLLHHRPVSTYPA
jgi:hypothetical protein